jgi:hypothetical protein
MKSGRVTRWSTCLALILATVTTVAQTQATQGHFAYMGTLDKKLLILNEDTDSIVGEIPLAGVPRTIVTSADQKQFYILNTDMAIEIVDIPTRKLAGSLNLMEMGGKVRVVAGTRNWMNGAGSQARFSGIVVDPNGRYIYSTVRVVSKELSEYKLAPPQFAVIDLTTKSVVKRMDFPKEWDTGFGFQASFKVSPDGKYLWVFDDDISILDLSTFKVVDKIALGKPPYPGASPYRLSPTDMPYDGTNKVTSVFVSIDPIVHKGTLGLASMDMNTRKVDYKPIGVQLPMIGFLIAPGGKVGYSAMYSGAGANRTTEWWAWDLVNHKVTKKEPFESRSTFSFGMSGDGTKLYMFGSGPSLEIYNAATLKSEKFIDLKKDLTTRVVTLDPTRQGAVAAE